MTTDRVAAAFVNALSVPDVEALRSLLAPEARFWVNIGPATFSTEERLSLLEVERSHLRTLAFEDVRVHPTPTGFVVQLCTVATTSDGADLRIPVCLVATADDDVINRVEEYADSAPAGPLLALMHGGSR
jgi:ketosteroid isomerase-like protein